MAVNEIGLEDLIGFGNLEILANQVVEGFITGLHKSPFHGFSVEFAEHRLYNTGDSIKNIDWKLFARTDKLFSKRFEEETNLRCQLVIDCSSSMFYPDKDINKFKFSALAAASIINLLKKQRDAFGLTLFAEDIELQTPARSTMVHQKFIYHQLEKYLQQEDNTKGTKLVENLHVIADSISKRAMIVLFSDLFENGLSEKGMDEVFAALQHLKYNKHEVIIFNVLDQKHEIDFSFENRPYQFIDTETGEQFKLNPITYANEYKASINSFKKDLDLRCAQYKIDLIHTDINAGFYQTLQAWLIKRNKMQ